jgi:hypothetical protein
MGAMIRNLTQANDNPMHMATRLAVHGFHHFVEEIPPNKRKLLLQAAKSEMWEV